MNPTIQEIVQLSLNLSFIHPQQLPHLKKIYQTWSLQNPQEHFSKFFLQGRFLTQEQLEIVYKTYYASHETLRERPENFPREKITQGSMWGNFEILQEIGRGGMGVVYKARQKNLERIVALKLLISAEITDQYRKRFLREAELSSQLEHENIVKTYIASIYEQTPYIAMEFIAGVCFKSYAKEHTLQENLKIVQQIAEALQYSHEKGILHRDVKPANILVDKNGKPYLTDFGLARTLRVEDKSLTRTGQVLGTPEYMSPEQAKGHKRNLDNRTDIYSLGVILYELATEKKAFAGKNSIAVLYKVLTEPPLPPHCIQPGIDKALEAIILKAMSYRKNDRYFQASHLAKDLNNFLEGKPISIRIRNKGFMWLGRKKSFVAKVFLCLAFFITSFLLCFSYFGNVKKAKLEDKEDSKNLYKKALSLYKQKEYEKASFTLEKYLKEKPFHKEALYSKARILQEQYKEKKLNSEKQLLQEKMLYVWESLYKFSKKKKDLKYLLYIAEYAFLHRKFKIAERYSQKISKISQKASLAKLLLLNIFMQEMRYDEVKTIRGSKIPSFIYQLCKLISEYQSQPREAFQKIKKIRPKASGQYVSYLISELYWWKGIFCWQAHSAPLNNWDLLKSSHKSKKIQEANSYFEKALKFLKNKNTPFEKAMSQKISIYKDMIDLELAKYPLDKKSKDNRKELKEKISNWEDSLALELLMRQALIRSFIRSSFIHSKNWKETLKLCDSAIQKFAWISNLYNLRAIAHFHAENMKYYKRDVLEGLHLNEIDIIPLANMGSLFSSRYTHLEAKQVLEILIYYLDARKRREPFGESHPRLYFTRVKKLYQKRQGHSSKTPRRSA